MTPAERRKWRAQWPDICWACGQPPGWIGMQLHHVERRSHGQRRGEIPANWLMCCCWCHEHLLATMPHAEQLAIVLSANPQDFNLEKWLRIRDPGLLAPRRVTEEEVFGFLEKYSAIGLRIRRIQGRGSITSYAG